MLVPLLPCVFTAHVHGSADEEISQHKVFAEHKMAADEAMDTDNSCLIDPDTQKR